MATCTATKRRGNNLALAMAVFQCKAAALPQENHTGESWHELWFESISWQAHASKLLATLFHLHLQPCCPERFHQGMSVEQHAAGSQQDTARVNELAAHQRFACYLC
jgi:hypothetical protein